MDEDARTLFAAAVGRATASCTGAALDAALSDLGWLDALADDPAVAVSVLFAAQGAANVSSSALDQLLARAVAPGADLPGGVGVVLPPLRSSDTPGRIEGDRCAVDGLVTEAGARCETALVVVGTGDEQVVVLAKVSDLALQPARGIDPEIGLALANGDCPLSSGTTAAGPADWPGALTLGRLALGHELVGSAQAMLELARVHALARIQFGRPISSFQAVRHRLADCLVAIEAAVALLDAASDEPSPVTATMAKALAGRSARTVARHCQQVLAGVGFTAEHPLHRHVRRVLVLDQLLGAGTALTRQLGAEVLERRSLPAAFPL